MVLGLDSLYKRKGFEEIIVKSLEIIWEDIMRVWRVLKKMLLEVGEK